MAHALLFPARQFSPRSPTAGSYPSVSAGILKSSESARIAPRAFDVFWLHYPAIGDVIIDRVVKQ